MARRIVRSAEEIEAAYDRAARGLMLAEDGEYEDKRADTAYSLLQWLFGDADTDPTDEMGMTDEDYEAAEDE